MIYQKLKLQRSSKRSNDTMYYLNCIIDLRAFHFTSVIHFFSWYTTVFCDRTHSLFSDRSHLKKKLGIAKNKNIAFILYKFMCLMNFNKHNSFCEMFKATRKIIKRKLIFFLLLIQPLMTQNKRNNYQKP